VIKPLNPRRMARRLPGAGVGAPQPRSVVPPLLVSLLVLGSGDVAADLKEGARIFKDACAECHTLKEGRNKKGPSVYAVVGRKAATIGDYEYSDAIRSSNIVWDDATLDAYLLNPNKVVPGGKMKYEGLKDPEKRRNVIRYLKFFSE